MREHEQTRKKSRSWAKRPYEKQWAWHECLFRFARHKNGYKWKVKGRTFKLDRGQFFCNKTELARHWGWSRRTVQRFFKEKEKAGVILQDEFHGIGTIIYIVDQNKAERDFYRELSNE